MKRLIAGFPVTALVIMVIIILSISGCARSSDTPALEEDKPPVSEQNTSDDANQQASDPVPEEGNGEIDAVSETEEDTSPTAEEAPEERDEPGIIGETHGGIADSEPIVVPITEDAAWTEWDTFISMSPAEQDAFMRSFDSVEEFASWMTAAQAAWAAAHPMEEIGPGSVIDFSGG